MNSLFYGKALITCLILGMASGTYPQERGDILGRGLSLVNASRLQEAEQVLRSVDESDASYVPARSLLGFLYLRRAAIREAEDTFHHILAKYPQSPLARLGLGMALLRKGMADSAAREFEKIVEDGFYGYRARMQKIHSLFLIGNEDEAFKEAKKLSAEFPQAADCHGLLGFLYQVRRMNEEAIEEYLKAAKLDPANLPTHLSLIALYRSQRDWDSVLYWSRKALALDENHPLLYREMHLAHQQLDDSEQAAAAWEEADRTYEAERLYTRAMHAKAIGKETETEALLHECLRVNPRLSKAWADLGQILRKAGRLDGAQHAFLMALETDPGNSAAHLGRATVLQLQGKESEALSAYQRALQWGVRTPDILAGMAALHLNMGKKQDAAEAMRNAIEELPNHPDLLSYLGYLHESNGESQAALTAYTRALRLNPTQIEALLGKANLLLEKGDIRSAGDAFLQVARMSPGNTAAWHGLIQATRRANDAHATIESCEACLRHNPADVECREQLAAANLEESNHEQAIAQFEILLRTGRASKGILDGLAFCHLKLGAYSKAIRIFKSSVKRFGDDAWIQSNLGFAYRCLADLETAIVHYRRACELSPPEPKHHYDLAYALYMAGNYGAAVESFNSALRLQPDWGLAHYNLAITHWNLHQYQLALMHARSARRHGIAEAEGVVQTLAAYLAPPMPKSVRVWRPKP